MNENFYLYRVTYSAQMADIHKGPVFIIYNIYQQIYIKLNK